VLLHFWAGRRAVPYEPAGEESADRRLEQELNVRLAHRIKRVVSLTRASDVYVVEARKMLRQRPTRQRWRCAPTAARSDSCGWERNRTRTVRGLPRDRRHLPPAEDGGVELGVREMTTAEQEHALRRGDLDVGLLYPSLDSPGLTAEEIGRPPPRS
jgi:DNA-binding transcriptional LysR family regulator